MDMQLKGVRQELGTGDQTMELNKDKQINIDIAVEEMASAVRERTVACNKCEYYKEGSCLKPIDLGCNDNEDILNLCDAIYENGYRKASEVAREIFEEIDKIVLASIEKDEYFREQMHTDTDRSYFEGGANSVRKLKWHIAELKKKYTEDK